MRPIYFFKYQNRLKNGQVMILLKGRLKYWILSSNALFSFPHLVILDLHWNKSSGTL